MADRSKEFPLSIVLRTVDKATAGLKSITDKIDRQLKPYKEFSKTLGKFSESLGLPKLHKSLANVGREVGNLARTFGGLALSAAAALYGFKSIVDSLDDLGDKAQRFGVTADFLAQIRYAAKRSGASVEELDTGLQFLSKNLGQAKAGTGALAGFLKKVSPPLLKQVKAAKSNEEAFDLMAKAMAKVKDPAKRSALATAAFGRGGVALAPLLARGSKGIDELRKRYLALAGSQEDAAGVAGSLDDKFHDVSASVDGLKASLVANLGPTLLNLIGRVTTFFAENRETITAWIKDFGDKLPGRIDAFIGTVKTLAGVFKDVWDMVGGAKGAFLLFVGIKVAPLITALLSVGAALIPIVAAAGPIVAMAVALGAIATFVAVTKESTGKFQEAGGTLSEFQGGVFEVNDPRAEAAGALRVRKNLQLGAAVAGGAFPSAAVAAPSEARVKVDFANAPKGTRITTDPRSTTDVDLSVGYQMVVAP